MRTSITPWTQTWNHCYLNSRKRKTKVRAEVCLVLVRLAVAPGAFLLFLYLFLSFTVFSTAIFAFVLDNHRSWSLKRVSPRSGRSFRRLFTKEREENEGGPGARFLSFPFSPPSPHCLLSLVASLARSLRLKMKIKRLLRRLRYSHLTGYALVIDWQFSRIKSQVM